MAAAGAAITTVGADVMRTAIAVRNVGFYFGAPYYDYGYVNPCWETRRVWTSRGWRLRRVWICY